MRTALGRFDVGYTYRNPKPFWERSWLFDQYVTMKKSAKQIATENGCHENNILYFLQKYGIAARSMSEIREKKHWGAVGEKNPMFGRIGRKNPRWNGGHSPERQSKYASHAWKCLSRNVRKRDGYKCTTCGSCDDLRVHHIKEWSRYPELRFETTNLITVCEQCHKRIHSRKK